MSEDKYKVLECRSSDNEYLHRDFHGALCYAVKYLDDTFGHKATAEYLQQAGVKVFSPLIAELKQKGLCAVERHFRRIFEIEGGRAIFRYEGMTLVIEVLECPAVRHLCSTGQLFTNRYCETTVNVNKAVCNAAGYDCSCVYEPGRGRCVQKFWKKENEVGQ